MGPARAIIRWPILIPRLDFIAVHLRRHIILQMRRHGLTQNPKRIPEGRWHWHDGDHRFWWHRWHALIFSLVGVFVGVTMSWSTRSSHSLSFALLSECLPSPCLSTLARGTPKKWLRLT